MYVKTLTLKGFKSFATPTTFEFEPGVTAIVGPNGSGKSNVVDALAWVMGEQGAKTLRGGRMEDVIFAGTAQRGPLGRAEVVLTIDNTDGALPIEYTEVSIRRTLFRSGASEYAINGRSCRLLDVQELLSDTGLGREMHVIVGQGRLDDVLRASPQERREFIEEAAGILKHRRRKERTLRKLDSMEANLARVQDLAAELRRQLKPLGAQAETARAAQEIQAAVRDGRSKLLARDLLRATETTRSAQEELETATAAESAARATLEHLRDRVHDLERSLRDPGVDEATHTSFALQQVLQRAESIQDLVTQQTLLLEAQPAAAAPQDPLPDLAATEAQAADAQAVADRCELQWEQAREHTEELAAELERVDQQVAERQALISAAELQKSRAQSRLESAEQARRRGAAELRTATGELEQAQARCADAEQAATDTESVPDTSDLDEQYSSAQAAVRQARQERDAAREALADAESARESARSRAGAFRMALSGGEGTPQAGLPSGAIGLVAERLRVQPGFERALSAALGSAGEAALADSEEAAQSIAAAARAQENEALLVVNSTELDRAAPSTPGPAPFGGTWALDVCRPDPSIAGLLAQTVIVERLPAETLPAGVTAVTRAGELRRGPLLHIPGHSHAGKVELAAAKEAAEQEAADAEVSVAHATQRLHTAGVQVTAAEQREAALLSQVRERDAEAARRVQAAAQATARLTAARQEAQRLSAAVEKRRTELTTLTTAVEAAQRDRDALTASPAPPPITIDRDGIVEAVRSARATEMESRVRAETAKREAASRQHQISEVRAKITQLQQERLAAARAEELRQHRLADARRVQALLPTVIEAIRQDVQQAQEQLGVQKAQQAARDQELTAARAEVATATRDQATCAERVGAVRLRCQQNALEIETLQQRARTELSVEPEDLLREYAPQPEDTADEAQIRADLKRAERELRRLGSVNPLALEQYAALEHRYADMTAQLKDLQETKRELLSLIAELDERMQGIYEAAFADTSAAFDRVLPLLFPGGTGQLVQTPGDDAASTGVDVVLRPVGKKVDRLSLLSGGERSLAALAVLISIFIARPSPFYIMDEVEAALDDANLGRLLNVFAELRAGSQLIVITHQKRTMEIADALYGVSMRKDGVSAVVGQRLSDRSSQEEA